MVQRGRPRYDDILTPREWEVLDLIREGLTNEQIAERLDISFATARFHVSEIISKLGVENRWDAARWSGKPRSLRAYLLIPLLKGFQVVPLQGATRVAAITGIGLVLLALLLLAIGVAYNAQQSVEEARQPATPTVAEAVDETRVIVYRPAGLPTDRQQGDYCIASALLPRDDAWACWGGRSPGLSQPCFGEPGGLEVVCPGRPEHGFHGAYILELQEPLDLVSPTLPPGAPTPVPLHPDELAGRAWWVETADGRLCGFKTSGTSPVVNGERLNFYCPEDDLHGLIGVPSPGKVWTARQVNRTQLTDPPHTGVPETIVELRTVWR